MRFSIIIPTYNYAHFLTRALDSTVFQGRDDYEIVVVDDGSTDDTAAVLERYISANPGKLKYVRQCNAGVSVARNRGVRESSGEYLLFLDADDALLPDALNRFRDALDRYPECRFICSGFETYESKGAIRRRRGPSFTGDAERDFKRYVTRQLAVPIGSAILHRSIFDRLQFPNGLRNDEDYVVFAQAVLLYRSCTISGQTVRIYKHGDSLRHEVERLLGESLVRFRAADGIPDAVMKRLLQSIDLVLDPSVVPARLARLRSRLISRRLLSGSRMCFEAGRYPEGRALFHAAIKRYPASIFEWRYVKRYLRTWLV